MSEVANSRDTSASASTPVPALIDQLCADLGQSRAKRSAVAKQRLSDLETFVKDRRPGLPTTHATGGLRTRFSTVPFIDSRSLHVSNERGSGAGSGGSDGTAGNMRNPAKSLEDWVRLAGSFHPPSTAPGTRTAGSGTVASQNQSTSVEHRTYLAQLARRLTAPIIKPLVDVLEHTLKSVVDGGLVDVNAATAARSRLPAQGADGSSAIGTSPGWLADLLSRPPACAQAILCAWREELELAVTEFLLKDYASDGYLYSPAASGLGKASRYTPMAQSARSTGLLDYLYDTPSDASRKLSAAIVQQFSSARGDAPQSSSSKETTATRHESERQLSMEMAETVRARRERLRTDRIKLADQMRSGNAGGGLPPGFVF